jgi:uncharacterized protein (TIRG00374 family)
MTTTERRGRPNRVRPGRGRGGPRSSTRRDEPAGHRAGDLPAVIDAPEPPRRVHRHLDLARLLLALAGLTGSLLIARITVHTVAGIGADVSAAVGPLPVTLVVLVTAASGLVLLALPVAVSIELLVRRRVRTFAYGLLAVALAVFTARVLQRAFGDTAAVSALAGHGVGRHAFNGFVAAIVAMVTVARLGQRRRWRLAAVAVFTLVSVALVSVGFTALAVVVSLLIGRVAGLTVRWAIGSPPSRPSPREVVATLRRMGIDPVSLRTRRPDERDPAVFDVPDAAGRALVVQVLDRDHVGSGLLPSLWRTLRVRQTAGWWTLLSLRRTLDQLALVSMAMAAAGGRVQRLVGAAPIEPDAAILVYEDLAGPTFADALPTELTDARLDAAWAEVALLHRNAIAHRALDAENLVASPDGGAGLRTTGVGLIAAGDTQLRTDLAHLLVTCGLLVGPGRAVASALRSVGPQRLAAAAPLLQPIVLGQSTRRRLRREPLLLDQLRDAIGAVAPSEPVRTVRVERLRMRTVVSAVALTVAAYVLVSQVAGLDLGTVVREADWRWLAVAVLLSMIRYVGAALGLAGVVADRLRLGRTIWVQVAASFVALVAPAGVGGAALNVRYLQRCGIPAATAVASVALWQLGTFITTVLVLVLLNLVSGANQTQLLSVPSQAVVALAAAVGIGALVMLVPAGRRFLTARLRPYVDQVRPSMVSVLTRPGQLATGLAGTLLQTIATVLVMGVCIDAFGGEVPWVVVSVVVLAGTALGSAAPTPGGLGAVEAVLATGLTAAAGLDGATAFSSVLLFRLLTFWLPVLPGWIAFTALQRRDAV